MVVARKAALKTVLHRSGPEHRDRYWFLQRRDFRPNAVSSTMMLFPIRIEHPFDVAVQCPHDADPRHHSRAAVAFGDQEQHFDRGLPLFDLLFGLR